MNRTFLIALEVDTPFSAETIARMIKYLFEGARVHVFQTGSQQ